MEFYNVCMNWDRLIGSPLSLFSSLFVRPDTYVVFSIDPSYRVP
jgi:hypothetical protein